MKNKNNNKPNQFKPEIKVKAKKERWNLRVLP